MKYRFQWTARRSSSRRTTRRRVYHAANVLFRTADGGQTWEAISPDLTRNDKTKQKWSGGPITGDNTGVEIYCTIFALAESPKQKGVLWAGSDDGLVHVTRDGGKTWTNVTGGIPGLPEWGTVSCIEPSPFDAGTAYVVVDAHRLDDMRPYLCKTTDFGKTWKSLDAGCRGRLPARRPRGPEKRGPALLGTERGVMFSTDDGATWQPLQLNLPTVAGPRPRGEGRRPGRRHARPVDLDPRRPAAGPRDVGAEIAAEGRAPVPRRRTRSAGATARATGVQHGDSEPAGGAIDLLLPQGQSQGRAEDRDPRHPVPVVGPPPRPPPPGGGGGGGGVGGGARRKKKNRIPCGAVKIVRGSGGQRGAGR